MERRVLYCEVDFLKNLVMGFSKYSFDEQRRSLQIIELLSISPIVFNSKEKLYSDEELKNHAIFNYISKRSLENNIGEHRWSYDHFSDFSNTPQSNELFSILLTTKSELDCNRIMKKWGILAFNNYTLLKYEHLFQDCGTALPDTKIKLGWKSILGYKYSNICNSIILIDNYLLQSDVKQTYANKSVKDNLIPILDALLPKEISIPFHLYIIACEDSYPFKPLMDEEDDESLYSLIRGLRGGKVPIKIRLIHSKKMFHDRVILSNNIWISSGMGFDLFGEEHKSVSKPTTISVLFPFIQCSSPWIKTAYENVINLAQRIAETHIGYGDLFVNRLLDWETEEKMNNSSIPYTKSIDKNFNLHLLRHYNKIENVR